MNDMEQSLMATLFTDKFILLAKGKSDYKYMYFVTPHLLFFNFHIYIDNVSKSGESLLEHFL